MFLRLHPQRDPMPSMHAKFHSSGLINGTSLKNTAQLLKFISVAYNTVHISSYCMYVSTYFELQQKRISLPQWQHYSNGCPKFAEGDSEMWVDAI